MRAKTTMNELFDRYERERLPMLGPRTQVDYRRHIAALRPEFGSRIACKVKPRDVGRFLDVPTGKIHQNKKVSVLSAVFTLAVGKWYIDGCDINPCLKVLRNESRPRIRYITEEEFLAVHAIAPFAVKLAMDLALLTGQRQGDILDMAWADILPTHWDLTQGKTGKHLGIRLSDAIKAVLLRARQRAPMYPRWNVVRTRTGDPYTHEGFRAMWQRCMANALRRGVIRSRFTFHDIRAKCASDKNNLADASALLGHTEQGLTRRVYKRNIMMVEPLR